MSKRFSDRESTYPYRMLVTPENGVAYYATVERADDPVEPGTPLNAETLNNWDDDLVKKCSDPMNLLDNSYFGYPVNQRGLEYYAAGSVRYTIDRWRAMTQNSVTVDTASKMILVYNASENQAMGFAQYLPDEKVPEAGKPITFACENAQGVVTVASVLMPPSGNVEICSISAGNTVCATVRVYSAADGARLTFMVKQLSTMELRWAALYEGEYTADTLPPYRLKSYTEELLECQRYFVKTRGGAGFMNAAETIAYIELPLPTIMRAVPSVEQYTVTSIRGGGKFIQPSAVTNFVTNSMISGIPMVGLVITGTFTGCKYHSVYYEGTVSLSADL